MHRVVKRLLAAAAMVLLPSLALAQGATLTGVVKDGSGGVLPGVTVEAASPALIEKTKSAVTDGTGQYRIIDLRPGTYSLTFTLPGFNTVKREGVEIAGTQTLTISIDMKVGGLEETITVTGETPVVDVQNARRETIIKAEVIESLPVTRAAGAILNITPGINVAEGSGGALSPTMTSFSARSSGANAGSVGGEGRYAINGFPVTAARSGGFASIVYDTVNVDEVNITVGGGLGESDIGGPVMNMIPRSGGNRFAGNVFLNTAGKWSTGDNLSSEQKAANPNLQSASGVISSYDWSGSYGGPIMKDKLWFFGSYRDLSTVIPRQGISANANAGDPTRWDYVASPIEARNVKDRTMYIGRVTGQFGKSRVRANTEYQLRCEGTPLKVETPGCHNRGEGWIGLGSGNQSPEATSTAGDGYFDVPFYLNQFSWTMPATNKLLFEAGYSPFRYQPIFGHPAPDADLNLIAVTEQSNAINPATGLQYAPVANFRYRSVPVWGPAKGNTDDVSVTASYVTGAHGAKIGYQMRRLDLLDKDQAGPTQLMYRFNQGVPNAVTYYMPDFGRRTITNTHSVFAQDSWTRGKLTLQGALRWDRASSYAPPELNGTTNTSFLNPTPITIEKTLGVNAYNDISPRAGVAYDLFGNGKTALKFNWGRYLAYAANNGEYTSTNPGATIIRSVSNRTWRATVAAGGNGDMVVDCDLLNPDSNGECAAVSSSNDRNFGKLGAQTQVCGAPGVTTPCGDSVLSGWGVRPGDTQYTGTIQQQLFPRVSVDFSFTHRVWHGFTVTDNLNRHAGGSFDGSVAGSYESYTINVPQDQRLPGGGGYPVTVYVPTAAANSVAAQNFLVREDTFGEPRDSHWDGFELNGQARLRGGLTVSLGSSTGRAIVDQCETVLKYGTPDPRDCRTHEDWQMTARGLASYTIPKVDVLVSATVRSAPPINQNVTWQVNTAQVITPLLGHTPAGAGQTTTITVTDEEHKLYLGGRRTTVDMRFAKVLRWNRIRGDVGIDLNNALNTNYATSYNGLILNGTDLPNTPRPSGFLSPSAIYNPRFVRFNFTVNF